MEDPLKASVFHKTKKGTPELPKNKKVKEQRREWTQKLARDNMRDKLFTLLYFVCTYKLDEVYRYVFDFYLNNIHIYIYIYIYTTAPSRSSTGAFFSP